MQLISKQEMISRKWRTFEQYPKQNEDIVLHIKGYRIRENKFVHDFIRVPNFDGRQFAPKDYAPKRQSVIWKFSWLPVSELTI